MLKSFSKKVGRLLLGVATLAAASSASAAGDTYKIGVLMPLSGGAAVYGVPAVNGVKLAVEEINAAGGIGGKKIEAIVRDSQFKPAVGTAAARELISKVGVDLLFGDVSSGVSLALSELAKQKGIVFFSPIAKTTRLTKEEYHDLVFQSTANTDYEGRVMVEIAKEQGAKKVCLTGFDFAYVHDLFKVIEAENIKQAAFTITNTFLVPLTTTDFNALITQLMSNDCDAVLGAIFGGGFTAMVKQAAPFGLFKKKTLMIWGGEVGSYEQTASLGADYPEGIWANAYDLWYHNVSDEHAKFHDALAKIEGKKETTMWPMLTYIGMKFVAAGLKKAGTSEPPALAKALAGMTIDTPLGPKTISADRHLVTLGEFWGKMKKVDGRTELQMISPVLRP